MSSRSKRLPRDPLPSWQQPSNRCFSWHEFFALDAVGGRPQHSTVGDPDDLKPEPPTARAVASVFCHLLGLHSPSQKFAPRIVQGTLVTDVRNKRIGPRVRRLSSSLVLSAPVAELSMDLFRFVPPSMCERCSTPKITVTADGAATPSDK